MESVDNFNMFEKNIDRWILDTNAYSEDFKLKAEELCDRSVKISENADTLTCLSNILNAYALAQNYVEYILSMEATCLNMLHNKTEELEHLESCGQSDQLREKTLQAVLKIHILLQNNMDLLDEINQEYYECEKALSSVSNENLNKLLQKGVESLPEVESKIIKLYKELHDVDALFKCFGRNCGCFNIPPDW